MGGTLPGMPRRKPRRPGRPTLLTAEVEKTLVNAMRAGTPMNLAAEHAGVSITAFENWLRLGREAIEKRDDTNEPEPVPDNRRMHVDLVEKVTKARAAAAVRAAANIQQVAAGGAILEETTRRYRDPETGDLVEETTVRRSAPDWRASAWYLERSHRRHYGKDAAQVELTGAGGGPVQIEASSPQAEALLARLDDIRAALPASDEDGDVVEGEVVGETGDDALDISDGQPPQIAPGNG